MMGQTLSTNNGYFNRILRSEATRVLREDFAQEKEPEKMGWIHIGENKWRKHPREEKQYTNSIVLVTQKLCPEDNK